MPELRRRKSITTWLILAVALLLTGIAVLWWDGQQEVVLYDGSYEALEVGTELYFGPSPATFIGWVLALLGVGAFGVIFGLVLRQIARFKTWILITGLLLLVAGLCVLIWDYNQVRSFGWVAYAPLSKADFAPQSAASILGKFGLVAGAFLAASYFGLRRGALPAAPATKN
ncbi:hypothetical protein QMQ05_08685 [Glutamicibacter ectropisis]|uniref:Uncharacterized protein n=1 Tax=Glutamicibacter ectropisis TaxID=3046593 RepID=A0AAU6W9G8_9MICC